MTGAPPKSWTYEMRHVAADGETYGALCGDPRASFYVWEVADLTTAVNPCPRCLAHPDYPLMLLAGLP